MQQYNQGLLYRLSQNGTSTKRRIKTVPLYFVAQIVPSQNGTSTKRRIKTWIKLFQAILEFLSEWYIH